MSYIQRHKSNYNTHHNQYGSFRIISNRIGHRKRRKQNKYKRQNHNSRLTQNFIQFIFVVLQGILVFVTWRLVESANKQADAALVAAKATQESAKVMENSIKLSEKSLKIQEKSMKITNRAYISVIKIEPTKINEFINKKITVKFLNSGQTPAYKAETRTRISLVEGESCPRLPTSLPEHVLSEIIVGKSGVFSITRKATLTKPQIDAIKMKKLFLNIIGTVEYRDVFNRSQWLKYQMFYNVDTEAYTYCKEHNEAS